MDQLPAREPKPNKSVALIVHATRKLALRVGRFTALQACTTTPESMLGAWCATTSRGVPRSRVFVDERTLLPVLLPLTRPAMLLARFPEYLAAMLDVQRVRRTFIDARPAHLKAARLATHSRSMIGVTPEYLRMA